MFATVFDEHVSHRASGQYGLRAGIAALFRAGLRYLDRLPHSATWKELGLEDRGADAPRSTIYKFLSEELGLARDADMDAFRCCHDMDDVLELCQPLKEMAWEVQLFYEEFREPIEEFQHVNSTAVTVA